MLTLGFAKRGALRRATSQPIIGTKIPGSSHHFRRYSQMQSFNARQNVYGVTIMAVLATALVCASSNAQIATTPKFLQHQQNPVQSVFAKSMIGFALERKCMFLSPSERKVFEDSLEVNTLVFRSYLNVIKVASSNEESVQYVKEMVQSAVRFTEKQACDESARISVNLGLERSLRFVEIIAPELNKPLAN
jgi:hypothetical protein